MKYSELKQQYPSVFLLFEKWVEKHHETALNIWNGSIRNEDVIEFLDENGVYICVGGSRSFWPSTVTTFFINQVSNYERVDHGKTRREATELTIDKAFELFEAKLKLN